MTRVLTITLTALPITRPPDRRTLDELLCDLREMVADVCWDAPAPGFRVVADYEYEGDDAK